VVVMSSKQVIFPCLVNEYLGLVYFIDIAAASLLECVFPRRE